MLLITNEQQDALNDERLAFYNQQEELAGRRILVGNAIGIPVDAWRRIDTRARDIQRTVLTVFNKLSAASQTPIGIADLVSYYPQVSDSNEVQVTMDGRLAGKGDQVNVKYVGTPTPIFTTKASMGWRQMEVIRKGGGMIDTKTIGNGQRKVAEALEDMVLNGRSQIVVDGLTIYGLRNFPQRNTNTHGLTLASATGAQWLGVFKALIAALIGDNAYGKVTVFLNYSDWLYISDTDYTTGYPKTILQRLMEMGQIAEIVPSSSLPANEVIGIADLAGGQWGSILNAMGMITRPMARQNPEDEYVFSVLAAAAPQFESDYDGRSQLAHLTAS